VNISTSAIFLRRSNISGDNLTTRRFTNSSLEKKTRFQNSNTIGLNLVSSLFIFLQISSAFSGISNLLLIKTNCQHYFLLNLQHSNHCQLWLLQRLSTSQCNHRIHNLHLALVGYKPGPTHTTLEKQRRLTTRSCTQESRQDAESSDAKQRPWSQS
jgi:hypothetical protein